MIHTFDHLGAPRRLTKQQRFLKAVRDGQMTEAELSEKPWLFRYTFDGAERVATLPAKTAEAVKQAKELLNGKTNAPSELAAFYKQKDAAKSLTIAALAEDWAADKYAGSKTISREVDAQDRQRKTLGYALPWWNGKAILTINATTIEDYASHRKPALTSADRELATLSNLCDWAVKVGKIEKNPFAERPVFAEVKQHCYEASPDNDEIWNRMLAWMFEPAIVDQQHKRVIRQSILAAGSLCFSGLTGLRPGEPTLLLHLPPLGDVPAKPGDLKSGTIFRDRTGVLRMKIHRLKRGQNPYVTLHPAAEAFLSAWRSWLAREKINDDENVLTEWRLLHAGKVPKHGPLHPDARPLFPLGTSDQTTLNAALDRASEALELPHYKPHGFGRGYFVKVRRSFGDDDDTIGTLLGQSGNGELVRSTYGDPGDLVGGGLFDWLPDDCLPAWAMLTNLKPLPQPGRKPKELCVPA